MKNLKATYIHRVIEIFARGRYSRSTEIRVSRWLTDGSDPEEKDRALGELWNESVSEMSDEAAVEAAYGNWSAAMSDGTPRRNAVRMLRFWQGVAASLLIALGLTGIVAAGSRGTTVPMLHAYCSPGELRTVWLPDGSEVLLNGRSSIVYPERFTGDIREVLLMGEANFKVAKDKRHPFIVRSDGISVTALGTEFDFKAYPDHEKVESTLLEGKIRVEYGLNGEAQLLQPSEQLIYDRNTHTVTVGHPPMGDITAWQRGEIIFRNASLTEILDGLEPHYRQEFVYDAESLPADRYTFRFNKDMSLQEVMEIVRDVAGNLKVSVNDNKCIVRCSS